LSVTGGKKEGVWQTQLSEDVPEPVDDEHYAKNEERRGLADARGVAVQKCVSGGLERVRLFLSRSQIP
jgi:hypothetical protein